MAQSNGADSLLNFIQQNKYTSSFYLKENDSVIGHLNQNKMMPVASTAKIIIAIEFAKQVSHNLFNENEMVSLDEINKYYIPNTDANAHPHWIEYERQKGNIINDSVPLIEVAKGMILFSSNADAEYLMDLLGINNINSNLRLLGITDHTQLYPWASALFLYQNPQHVKEEKIIREIKKLDDEQYAKDKARIKLPNLLLHSQIMV